MKLRDTLQHFQAENDHLASKHMDGGAMSLESVIIVDCKSEEEKTSGKVESGRGQFARPLQPAPRLQLSGSELHLLGLTLTLRSKCT